MTSLAPSDDGAAQLAAQLAARLAGLSGCAATRGGGGGNNRIYRVDGRDADGTEKRFALKCYPPPDGDSRDRLAAEFGALTFLAAQGVECAPKAIAADTAANAALYQWIDGGPPGPIGARDIDDALAFVRLLRELAALPAAAALPEASEAFLRDGDAATQVARRLDRLTAVGRPELTALLRDGIAPAFARWRAAAQAAGPSGPPCARRTLSPSDFGFHNALRRADGGLTFVDFEYFGWDDPVKLTADFLLHPGMALDDALKARFLAGATEIFAADPAFSPRFAVLYPLVGLRWCLIILNEFLPERWSRRAFAGAGVRAEAEERQLAKARSLLELLLKHDGRPSFVC